MARCRSAAHTGCAPYQLARADVKDRIVSLARNDRIVAKVLTGVMYTVRFVLIVRNREITDPCNSGSQLPILHHSSRSVIIRAMNMKNRQKDQASAFCAARGGITPYQLSTLNYQQT